jgi:hypothetical protein
MRRLLPLVLGLALLGGCGGSNGETGGTHTETLPLGSQATDVCLGEHGFSIRPAASGVSAVAPSGAEFTVAFYETEAEASDAAAGAEGSTAVANAVVTPEGKRLNRQELSTVEDCVRGS